MSLHPLVEAAADGRLPDWSRAGKRRRAHMERVAALLEEWAAGWGLPRVEVRRWQALGRLHDVLRDADPDSLRRKLGEEWAGLPDSLLHGPAGARRLEKEGVSDAPFLLAVAYHTVGHPELDRMGRALFAADFLEPGRTFLPEWRGALRDRMLSDMDGVVSEVARVRMERLAAKGNPIRPESRAFLARLTEGMPA